MLMLKYAQQTFWLALFALVIGYFSIKPAYHHMPPEQALLRLSFSHAGQLLGDCHQRTSAELQKLAPNMRAAQDCPRERSPVTIEVDFDGRTLYREVIQPSGLSRDGAATVYRRFPVVPGKHQVEVRLNDSVRHAGFNYTRKEALDLRPRQVLVIDFNQQQGGVVIK
jgi:hypothetical protein